MGGAERAALNLAKMWSDLGDEVVVMPTYSGGGSGSFYHVSAKVTIRYLGDVTTSKRALPRLWALKQFVSAENFDVVVSFITNVNVAAIIAGRLSKVPVIACERSDPFVIPIPLVWKLARAVSYPFATHVVIQTNELLDKFRRSRSTYKSKLVVIPNSIPSVFLGHRGPSDLSGRILAVGRLSKEKQFDQLISAFSMITRREGWTVEIFGDGDEKDNLQELIESLNLGDQVFLQGAESDIEHIYTPGDLFCLTSRYEGFPNALLEAMASGCAVVSYRTPCGPSEMLDYGANGILVDLDDVDALARSIEKVMRNDVLRRRLSERSQKFVIEKYSAEVVLNKWKLILNSDGSVADHQ